MMAIFGMYYLTILAVINHQGESRAKPRLRESLVIPYVAPGTTVTAEKSNRSFLHVSWGNRVFAVC